MATNETCTTRLAAYCIAVEPNRTISQFHNFFFCAPTSYLMKRLTDKGTDLGVSKKFLRRQKIPNNPIRFLASGRSDGTSQCVRRFAICLLEISMISAKHLLMETKFPATMRTGCKIQLTVAKPCLWPRVQYSTSKGTSSKSRSSHPACSTMTRDDFD